MSPAAGSKDAHPLLMAPSRYFFPPRAPRAWHREPHSHQGLNGPHENARHIISTTVLVPTGRVPTPIPPSSSPLYRVVVVGLTYPLRGGWNPRPNKGRGTRWGSPRCHTRK
jgi:hypothetical protein